MDLSFGINLTTFTAGIRPRFRVAVAFRQPELESVYA